MSESGEETLLREIAAKMSLTGVASVTLADEPEIKIPQFTESLKTKLRSILRRENQKKEIEVSFGAFKEKNFVPGIPRNTFERIGNSITTEKLVPVRDTVYISSELKKFFPDTEKLGFGNHRIRKFVSETGEVRFELKRRERVEDDHENALRVSVSAEIGQESIPFQIIEYFSQEGNIFETTRRRDRVSFELTNLIRLDMTKSHTETAFASSVKNKFEVELEVLDRGSDEEKLADLLFCIETINALMCPEDTLPILGSQRNAVTQKLNDFFGNKGAHFNDSSLVKPINLVLSDLYGPFPYLTLKLDGYRALLFASPDRGVWIVMRGEAGMIHPPDVRISTFVCDGEYYQKTMYLFDCLVFEGVALFEQIFSDRKARISKIVSDMTSLGLQVVEKEYLRPTTNVEFCQMAGDLAIKSMVETEKYDGIIFQPNAKYYEEKPRKWKPSGHQTADFKVRKMKNGGYTLEVVHTSGMKKGKVAPYPKFDYPVTISGIPSDVSGLIVEILIGYENDNPTFTYVRTRDDKTKPNAIVSVDDVWRDVRNPVSIETLSGEGTQLVRRYFNMRKLEFIKTYFAGIEVLGDVGCGQGGDQKKWNDAKIKRVEAFDVDQKMLDEFKNRLLKTKLTTAIRTHLLGFEETEKVIDVTKTTFNGISAFFSLTFFGKSEEKMDALVKTISSTLEPGGFFVGIVFDGKVVGQEIKKGNLTERSGGLVNITGLPGKSPYGNEIVVTIGSQGESWVENVREYLFPYDEMKKKLQNNGFHELKTGFLGDDANLPPYSKLVANMNRFFVFRKEGGKEESMTPQDRLMKKGFEVLPIEKGPNSLIQAVLKSLGFDRTASSIRGEMSAVSMDEFKTFDGGQLAGAYQQDIRNDARNVAYKRKIVEKIGRKILTPKDYLLLGYEKYIEAIKDVNSFIGLRLGVEQITRILGVAVRVYSGLAEEISVYHGQDVENAKYATVAHVYYDGMLFTPLISKKKEVKEKIAIFAKQLKAFRNARALSDYLKTLPFPFIDHLINIEEIKNFEYKPVVEKFEERPLRFVIRKGPAPPHFDAATDPFTGERRLSCNVKGKVSPIDYWRSGPLEIANLIYSEQGDVTVERLHDAFYQIRASRVCTEFHLSHAIALMQLLLPGGGKILDPCAGHGARLMAALKTGNQYTGVDPDQSLKKGHLEIIRTFSKFQNQAQLIYEPFEEVPDSLLQTYDLVLTSPPYFDWESYSRDQNQSTSKFSNFEAWKNGFLKVMMTKSWKHLAKGGYLAIHIQNVAGLTDLVPATVDIGNALPGATFFAKIELVGDSDKFRPVWVWKK